MYNDLSYGGTEFGYGVNIHFFKNEDAHAARCVPLFQNTVGQEQLMKSILPITPFASFHVIKGPPGEVFTKAIIIKYCDLYRPMKKPEMWKMEIQVRFTTSGVFEDCQTQSTISKYQNKIYD
jgi:hypothetical protein